MNLLSLIESLKTSLIIHATDGICIGTDQSHPLGVTLVLAGIVKRLSRHGMKHVGIRFTQGRVGSSRNLRLCRSRDGRVRTEGQGRHESSSQWDHTSRHGNPRSMSETVVLSPCTPTEQLSHLTLRRGTPRRTRTPMLVPNLRVSLRSIRIPCTAGRERACHGTHRRIRSEPYERGSDHAMKYGAQRGGEPSSRRRPRREAELP